MISVDGLFMTLWLLDCLLTEQFQHFPGKKKKRKEWEKLQHSKKIWLNKDTIDSLPASC